MLTASRARGKRLTGSQIMELGELSRSVSADLAIARRRFAHDPVIARLERLAVAAHATISGAGRRRLSIGAFFSRQYWQLIAARPRLVTAAAALLVGPALLAAVWGMRDPASAAGLIPEEFRSAAGPATAGREVLAPDQTAEFAASLFTHNITVALMAFALGITFCLGTAFVLINNGVLLGAITGISIDAERTGWFVDLVAAHGVLELSCVIVASAAGLRMGMALIDPGNQPRGERLREEAANGVLIVLGTMPWLVVAGIVESVVTAALPGPLAGLIFGVALGGVFWALVVWRGRDAQTHGAVTGVPVVSP